MNDFLRQDSPGSAPKESGLNALETSHLDAVLPDNQHAIILAQVRSQDDNLAIELADITRFGARIASPHTLRFDEIVTVTLPGLQPSSAVIAWTESDCAGLEFVHPLPPEAVQHLKAQVCT